MSSATAPAQKSANTVRESFWRWWATARTSFFWMVGIAFLLRAGYVLLLHTYKFKPMDDHFGFGFEMGRVGRALATGQGFSNPFGGQTGPTAWEPPLYPFFIGGVFRLFGIYTDASAIVLLLINSVFSALNCVPIFLIGRRCFGEKVAIWSAWIWAVFPYFMSWAARWAWETSLSALLMSVLFWLALEFEEKDGLKPWLEFGLLWGITALNSPSLLAFLPVSGLWTWYRRARRGKRSLAGVVLSAAVFLTCITPWTLRNYQTFGKLILTRDNFGAELRLGNGPWADGTCMCSLHPSQSVLAMQQYQQLGEIAYIEMRKQQALDFIQEDYRRFAVISLKRFFYYWNGIPRASEIWWLAETKDWLFLATSALAFWGLGRAVRQRKSGAGLLLLLFLSYPTLYYFIFPQTRYRHPIEPVILLLGVFVMSEATGWPTLTARALRRRGAAIPTPTPSGS